MSIKKAIIIFIILAVIGVSAVFFMAGKKEKIIYTTALIERGNIVQTVSETGTVKASNEINLSFLNTGKISKIYFKIGDLIKNNQLLAELDYSSLAINKEEAQANFDVARENLNKLLAGATAAEVAVARANVKQAKIAYEAAQNELIKTKNTQAENIAQAEKTLSDLEIDTANNLTTYEQAIKTAETSLNNTKYTYQNSIDNYKDTALTTIENKLALANTALDTINRTITDEDAKDLISAQDITYLNNTKNSYRKGLTLLTDANSGLAIALDSNNNNKATAALDSALLALNKVFIALQDCFYALEHSVTSASFTLAELDIFKTNINAEQTSISAAISLVQSAQQNLDDAILAYNTNLAAAADSLSQAQASYDNAVLGARNTLSSARVAGDQAITAAESKADTAKESYQVAQAKLNQTTATASRHDTALMQAKIRQAQAALSAISQSIENSLIKAPRSGQITKIAYEIGEQVAAGAPVISVLGEDSLEIEVDISEADIVKVKKSDLAEITLDAFGDDIKFNGQVSFIEPAETIIQDVIYYKVTINFDPKEQDVKSGMTANVIITTNQKNNILIIPSRAIIEKNGLGKFVRVLVNNQIQEKKITAGMRGDEGMVEILSGLKEGESVVTYVRNGKK